MEKIFISKKKIENQNYESYWKLTLEYSDIYGDRFRECLSIIINFIEENKGIDYSSQKYKKLQNIIHYKFPKSDMASTRKSINQFVKLGFIFSKLSGYPKESKEYIENISKEKRKSLFSKIVYAHSSFNSSMDKIEEGKEINFFIKTLQNIGNIDKKGLIALMTVNVKEVEKGYYTSEELKNRIEIIENQNFFHRKYNQFAFLWKIIRELDGIKELEEKLYLEDDSENILDENIREKTKKTSGRDSYLQSIYKKLLKEESTLVFGKVGCMATGLPFVKLIASHIKPYRCSDELEAYDSSNGLLLSLDLDQLFDSGKITFLRDGKIYFSRILEAEIKEFYQIHEIKIKTEFLTHERFKFLEYHRENIFIE